MPLLHMQVSQVNSLFKHFANFVLWLNNFQDVLCFIGVIAIWNFVLHWMHFQDLWRTWLKGLRIFIAAGILFAAISIVSFIAFIAVAAVRKESKLR